MRICSRNIPIAIKIYCFLASQVIHGALCHRWLILLLILWMRLAPHFIVPECVGFWVFKTSLSNTIQSSTIAFLYVYVLFVKQVQLSQTFSEVWREFYFKNAMRFYHFIDAMPSSSFCIQPNILYFIVIIKCF